MKKRVLISAGGTGGHVYPAIALAGQLLKKHPQIKILFVGGKLSTNRFFQGQPYDFQEVPCGTFSNRNPLKMIKSFINIVKGTWSSWRIMKTYSPDLVVGFGSYHTFPTLFAAKCCMKPIILHEANSIPGKVNRLLSKHVEMTGVQFPEAASLLSGKTQEVSLPLRERFQLAFTTKQEACAYFGLNPEAIVILVFGGSQGAKALNTLFCEALSKHSISTNFSIQILHFTGDPIQSHYLRQKYLALGVHACVKELEERMDFAWAAADLLVSRAGAATIAEEMEFEVPGILIPYPFAADHHQDKNADFLTTEVGGGLKFAEADLTPEKLSRAILGLLADQQSRLKEMQQAIRLYKTRSKRTDLCSLVCQQLMSS